MIEPTPQMVDSIVSRLGERDLPLSKKTMVVTKILELANEAEAVAQAADIRLTQDAEIAQNLSNMPTDDVQWGHYFERNDGPSESNPGQTLWKPLIHEAESEDHARALHERFANHCNAIRRSRVVSRVAAGAWRIREMGE